MSWDEIHKRTHVQIKTRNVYNDNFWRERLFNCEYASVSQITISQNKRS